MLLDEPTRDGDTELHILTNVPVKDANAIKIAELYRWRWDIEHIFYLASTTLTCEVDGLNYPKSNLFVFCMAMMAMNCRQVLMGALVAAHGEWVEEEISHYSVSHEISRSFDSVLVVFDEDRWNALLPADFTVRMKFLKVIAKNVNVSRHRKARRGPKKLPPRRRPTRTVLTFRFKRCSKSGNKHVESPAPSGSLLRARQSSRVLVSTPPPIVISRWLSIRLTADWQGGILPSRSF